MKRLTKTTLIVVCLLAVLVIGNAIADDYYCWPEQGCTGTPDLPSKGSILAGTTPGTYSVFSVGSNYEVLHADSTQDVGMAWTSTLGDASSRLTAIYTTLLDTTNIAIGGVVTGGLDMNGNNIINGGNATFGSLDVDTLNLNGNVISDSTGTISFDDENLTTTGNITINSDVNKLILGAAEIFYDGEVLMLDNTEASKISLGDNSLVTTGRGTFGRLVVNTSTLVVNASGFEGRVGIGTDSPSFDVSIAGVSGTKFYYGYDNPDVADGDDGPTFGVWRKSAAGDKSFIMQINSSGSAIFGSSGNQVFSVADGYIYFLSTDDIYFNIGTADALYIRDDDSVPLMTIKEATGNVGIGEEFPEYRLEVLDTSTQLLLTYSNGIDTEFYVDSGGDLRISPSGGDIFLDGNVGIGVIPTQKLTIGSDDGSDRIEIYHDNFSAYIKWDDGALWLQTNEGTDTDSFVNIRGKGTGIGYFRVNDGEEFLQLSNSDGYSYIQSIGTSPNSLNFQARAEVPITMFRFSASGETQELRISGFRTGDQLRTLEIGVGVDADDTASFDGVSNYFFDGSIGIGDTSPDAALEVTTSTQGADYFMISTNEDTNGDIFIVDSSGNVGIGTDSPNNLFQVAGLINFDNSLSSTFLGYQAGTSITNGDGNTFVGYQTGYSNTTGFYNVFIGEGAGYDNIDGFGNVFVGHWAGHENTEGYKNVFIGDEAGYNNTTGYNNIIMGEDAGKGSTGGNNNVCMGTQSCYSISTGYNNICMGEDAGMNITEGFNNLCIGDHSGGGLTTGDYNVFMGSGAGNSNAEGSNNVLIGRESGKNVLGSGNVFIGYQAGYNQTNNSNLLIIDNQNRSSIANEASKSLIYGIFNADPANQTLTFNANTSIDGNLSVSGLGLFNKTPVGTGVGSGSVYINPPSATANYTLLGLAINGAERFKIDEDGDIISQGGATFAGDVVFAGSGSGLPYGEIYTDDNSTAVVLASQDTWYDITIFDANGLSNLTTADHTDDTIKIVKAGVYMVTISLDVRSTSSNAYYFAAFKNKVAGTELHNIEMRRNTTVADKPGSVTISGLVSVTVDDTISIGVQRKDGGGTSKSIIIEHANITITMVGGN